MFRQTVFKKLAEEKHRLRLKNIITDMQKFASERWKTRQDIDGETPPDSAIEKMRDIAIEYNLANYAMSVVSSHTLEEGIKGFVRKPTPTV